MIFARDKIIRLDLIDPLTTCIDWLSQTAKMLSDLADDLTYEPEPLCSHCFAVSSLQKDAWNMAAEIQGILGEMLFAVRTAQLEALIAVMQPEPNPGATPGQRP